jgi:hypothetical protein
MAGWIKLHRKLKNSPIWYSSTPSQKVVLITLLLLVEWETTKGEWKGEEITLNPGQKILSLKEIKEASGSGSSTKKIRCSLEKLRKHDFLAMETANCGHLITILNWETYQDSDIVVGQADGQVEGKQRASKGQTPIIIEEIKKRRNKERINSSKLNLENQIPFEQEEKEIIFSMPVIGGECPICKREFEMFKETYPAVDVLQAMKEMKAWCLSNPKNTKTPSGVLRFINSWLSRAQNNGRNNGGTDLLSRVQLKEPIVY